MTVCPYSPICDPCRVGEYRIYKYLRGREKCGGRFFFNVYLSKSDGGTTEADVILVDPHGIFVFESKNYSGWIFGNEDQRTWTQSLPQGKGQASRKEHFLNPIIQNRLHITALRQLIGDMYPFRSVIVFSERCTLKDVTVSDPSVCVVKREDVFAAVRRLSSQAVVLPQEEIERIRQTLLPLTQVSGEVKEQHIQAIREKDVPDVSVCPRCGGKLVLRTASHGVGKGNQFYGCSNYPRCYFTKNL